MRAGNAQRRAARTADDLYRAHATDVYRYALAVLGNESDAEDVTQTTFVNALRALERGERPRAPRNWLIAIAHNIVRQRWRQEHVRPVHVELADDVPAAERGDDGRPLGEVVVALQRIPPNQREALVMRELEGRSYGEIAELLGVSASAVETLVFRARRSLAEELESLVTCEHAELAISRRLDGRLGRKERRRLEEHLRTCRHCASFATGQQRHRTAMRGLAVLPLPASLLLWKGAPTASAATLPTIGVGTAAGAGAVAATGSVGAGTAASGAAGGLALGGVAAKAAAVVAAVGVAGGASYEGAKLVTGRQGSPPPAAARAAERAAPASAHATTRLVPGKARAAAAKEAAAARKAAAGRVSAKGVGSAKATPPGRGTPANGRGGQAGASAPAATTTPQKAQAAGARGGRADTRQAPAATKKATSSRPAAPATAKAERGHSPKVGTKAKARGTKAASGRGTHAATAS